MSTLVLIEQILREGAASLAAIVSLILAVISVETFKKNLLSPLKQL
jgi:hypothetical protein